MSQGTYNGQCIECGEKIDRVYDRCYRCNRFLRRLEREDSQLGGDKFYVYVLETSYGHYVGHTGNLEARIQEHVDGQTRSTAGGNPRLLFASPPYETRREAADMEARLTRLRDEESPRYQEITRHAPVSFDDPYTARRRPRRGLRALRRRLRDLRRRGR